MSYKLVKINDNRYQVIEIASQNIMLESENYNEAYEKYRELKQNKNGFCGWTPKFILPLKK